MQCFSSFYEHFGRNSRNIYGIFKLVIVGNYFHDEFRATQLTVFRGTQLKFTPLVSVS